MFLKSAKLKRLVKQAYKKSVLRLGDMGERLYIAETDEKHEELLKDLKTLRLSE